MNEPISWDPSLVKKFSSSNHYKLLNQLRNEVKKYPLNNKKKTSSIQIKDTNIDSKNSSNNSNSQNSVYKNNINQSNLENSHKSTVSFNNSKNFSIYTQSTNNHISRPDEIYLTDQSTANEDSLNQTFKERLNHIDFK